MHYIPFVCPMPTINSTRNLAITNLSHSELQQSFRLNTAVEFVKM